MKSGTKATNIIAVKPFAGQAALNKRALKMDRPIRCNFFIFKSFCKNSNIDTWKNEVYIYDVLIRFLDIKHVTHVNKENYQMDT